MNVLSPIACLDSAHAGKPPSGDVAIIGMSGRFPGASSVDALWQNVRAGRDAFRHFDKDEIEDAFDDVTRASADYVPSRPALDGVELFDAGFFGMMAREAAVTDPQQRVFLEICWEALEHAGYDPARYPGSIGVYAGASLSTYLLNNVLSDRAKVEEFTSTYQIGSYHTFVGAIADTLATRVAFKLDLKGPAITMLTACSTSLLCVAEACHSLLSHRTDMALAGGVSITFPQKRGYLYQPGGMVAPDGVCRPLDADAGGTVFGSGAGVVLLKRLEDAVADCDTIHAVIRGCGVNNDGAGKVSYTGPSVDGQAAAISAAHVHAGIDPASIGYVECHGTATPLGDPIEFMGLMKAFRAVSAKGSCVLGSTKGNVGHLDAAAGVTGLIKTAMMLRDREIPPLAQYRSPNPRIDLDRSPFTVETRLRPWTEGPTPRRAGVSAFGIGGTNVHVVLEEPPSPPQRVDGAAGAAHILPLSARSQAALDAARAALAEHLAATPDLALADAAFTLQEGRRAFRHRTAIVCRDATEARDLLAKPARIAGDAASPPALHFMFPGQGSQYPGMASGLYASDRAFAAWIDHGAAVLEPMLGFDIRTLICRSDMADQDAARALRDTQVTQPALFLVEFATAQLWLERGAVPSAMIGHSVGEFVAASVSGVLSFEDALHLIAHRGRLMRDQPGGAMLSVRASEAEVRALLLPGIDIAALNAPKLSVVAGSFASVEEFENLLAARGLATSRLHTSHAFHSAMMDPVVAALGREAARMRFSAPQIPFVSSVTGGFVDAETLASPDYWAGHCRATVRFADGLRTLCADRKPLLLEVGPGRTLSVFAAQTIGRDDVAGIVQSLPDHDRAIDDECAVAEAHARLWSAGVEINWHRATEGRRIPLPTYRFERERHWLEAPKPHRGDAPASSPACETNFTLETTCVVDNCETAAMNATPVFPNPVPDRRPRLEAAVLAMLVEMSGEELTAEHSQSSFLELGFDSLFLGQVSQDIDKRFGVRLSFRQLLSDFSSIALLAEHLDAVMAPDAPAALPAAPSLDGQADPAPQPVASAAPLAEASVAAAPIVPVLAAPSPAIASVQPLVPLSGVEGVLHGQMQTMQALFTQQMQLLQGMGQNAGGPASPVATAVPAAPVQASPSLVPATPVASPSTLPAAMPVPVAAELDEGVSRFRMFRPGMKSPTAQVAPETTAFIADLVARYGARNPTSKAMTQASRSRLADPRTVAGFRPAWKDAVFPIVSDWSKGSRLRDLDGNDYVDVVSGYGQSAFGHAPDFVVAAVAEQLQKGFAIGPQSPMAGAVAARIGDMIGHERVTFCNTGSEAVMAAMRVARSVTGRDKVVVFSNDYHGQFDEVLVKGRARSANPAALPIAPGIPTASVANMVVLGYGAPESLDWIRAHGGEIAAVVIEPVQSRHPELRPVDFVRALRALTLETGSALVFDEVVSGFRAAPGGVQALWGIKGDMATYGKVLGGGMPLGILAGSARFMDALDGGYWSYGDASEPEVSPTFFAGTFVRHPLVLAAAQAVLDHIGSDSCDLYTRVAPRTAALVAEINADLAARGVPARAQTFSSWFMINFGQKDPLGSLIYIQMRLMGLHIQEGFPCYLTSAHSEADFVFIAETFRRAVDVMQAAGILLPQDDRTAVFAPTTTAAAPSTPAPRPDSPSEPTEAPLTQAQMEVWLAAQLGDDASCAFNESFSLRLVGPLDAEALRASLQDVVDRHDALRVRFDRGGRSQSTVADFQIPIEAIDLAFDTDAEAKLAEAIAIDARTAFDLVAGPLSRAKLVRLGADSHVLVFTAHHIVCDGWSGNIIAEELVALYRARVSGAAADLPAAPSFVRHALEEAALGRVKPEAEGYWLSTFATIPDNPDLPLDRPRPDIRSFAGATHTGFIDGEAAQRIKRAGARHGCTLFSTLLAVLQATIGRLSGSDDIVIAIPSAGQSLYDKELLVGHCVNLLPLRVAIDTDKSVKAHLATVQQRVFEAFEHQGYTYGTLVAKLDLKRSPGLLPLTQIQFNLERHPARLEAEGLTAELAPNPKAFSNFDLFLNVIESREGLRIDVDYNTEILDAATVGRWVEAFKVMLDAVAHDQDRPVSALPLVAGGDADWLIDGLNATDAALPEGVSVIDLFERQVAAGPERVAATHRDASVTYRALSQRVDRFAHVLTKGLPQPCARVAVAVGRSIDMLVALLAVMKAGHTYVPLDPTHPAARLSQALQTGRVAGLICDDAAIAALAPATVLVVRLDTMIDAEIRETAPPRPAAIKGDQAAYVIFTSGSTGVPKGVEVPHRALSNFLLSMAREPGLRRDDVIVALTTVSFDIAALELYLPLIVGATVVIADRSEVTDGFALVDRIRHCGATVVQATPTLWLMLLEAGLKPNPGLKMLCGGEALPRDLANRLLAGGGPLWNMYGPTETTIWSSVASVTPGEAPITIGHPIDNTSLHILSPGGQLQPVGVVGELHIGGTGLATGYFDQAELTQKVFRTIALSGRAPQRFYNTGDVGRRLADGSLELLGRRDQQVKLRGFRIELGDIEAVLRGAPGVQSAAVALKAKETGDRQLVGYYVALPGETPLLADIVAHAGKHLPAYMVPTAWRALDALPQTGNGKLDRKALPEPAAKDVPAERQVTRARTPMETVLAAIWTDVLGIPDIGMADNLFALGADSLSMFRIAARMIDRGLGLDARDLLRHPTIEALAARAAAPRTTVAAPPAGPDLKSFRNGAHRGLAGVK